MVYKLDIEERYAYYTKYISRSMMPISLNIAKWLYDLCQKLKPNYILDNGSGFSSFIFRKYKLMMPARNIRVITTDNSERWLNETRQFIRKCGMVPEDTYLWRDFWPRYAYLFEFDLILEDSFYPNRGKMLAYDIKVLKPNGIMIVDDAHKPKTTSLIYRLSKRNNLSVNYLKKLIDGYKRYPALLRRRRN